MSACNFKIPFSIPLSGMVEKARTAVESQGGQFTGDENAGNFSVSIMGNSASGSYKTIGNELHIQIDDKPLFVPCSLIESYLSQQLK